VCRRELTGGTPVHALRLTSSNELGRRVLMQRSRTGACSWRGKEAGKIVVRWGDNLPVAHALRISGGHERGLFTAEIRGARVASLFSRSHFWHSSWKTNDPGARPLTSEFSPVHSRGRAESHPCWCSILSLASTNFCFPSELLHRAGLTTRRASDVSSVAKTRPGAWRFGLFPTSFNCSRPSLDGHLL
jgi:hypothetical protein